MGLKQSKLFLILTGFLFLIACTNAVPKLSGLNLDGLSTDSPDAIAIVSGNTFSNTLVNFSSQQTVTLKNQATKSLTLNSLSFADGTHFSFVGGSYPGSGVTSGCGTSLAAGATCNLKIKFAPQTASIHLTTNINVSFSDGTKTTAGTMAISGVASTSYAVTVSDVYTTGNTWNKYIKNDGSKSYNATGATCAGTETGDYTVACVHAAEIKKVQVTALTDMSCSNLTITDNLGLFNWTCDDSAASTTGLIIFYSTSLKRGKGLRHLIQSSGSSGTWSPNNIEVRVSSGGQSGTLYASSTAGAWWANSIQQLPDNLGTSSSTLLSDTSHPIYVIGTDQSTEGGYQIGADGISIVTLGSNILSQVGSTLSPNCKNDGGSTNTGLDVRAVFCSYQKKFLWLEVNVHGGYGTGGVANYAGPGIILNGALLSRIQDSKLSNFNATTSYAAVRLIDSSKNLIRDVETYNTNAALSLDNSSTNLVQTFKAAKIVYSGTASGISLNSSNSNKLTDLQISGMTTGGVANGIYSNFSDGNIFQRILVSNIDAQSNLGVGTGIELSDATNHVVSQVTVSGVEGTGIMLDGVISVSSNYLSHINLINNTDFGLQLWGGLVSNNIFHSLVGGNGDVNISIYGADASPSINNTFYNTVSTSSLNSDGSIQIDKNYEANFHGFTVTRASGANSCSVGIDAVTTNLTSACRGTAESSAGISLSSFVGKVTSDDSMNPIDTSGLSALSSLSSIAKWFDFAFGFRLWSRDGNIFPDSTNQGPCDATFSCRIWDFRLKAGSALVNNSFSYSTANPNFTFSGGTCGGSLDGSDIFTVGSRNFLKHAIEIEGDTIGNDNGLCESNESCVYAPNIGAYQGEDGINTSNYCTTEAASVSVTNAKIYKYTTTSVP